MEKKLKMEKQEITKDDGRYLLFYTFDGGKRRDTDVGAEMESDSEGMGCNCNPPSKQDI